MKLTITDIDTGDEVAQTDMPLGEDVRVDTGRGIWHMRLEKDRSIEDKIRGEILEVIIPGSRVVTKSAKAEDQ